MIHILFLQNTFSFSHQLDVPFIRWISMEINLPIATQIPRIHYLNRQMRNAFKEACANGDSFSTAKLSVAHLLPSFLRFTAYPACYWGTFLTSAHFVLNVMRGHRLSLCHSVKHYKTSRFKNASCSMSHQ